MGGVSCRGRRRRRGNGLSKTLRQGQLEGQWVRSTVNEEDRSRSTRRGGRPGHRGPADPPGIACLLPLESLLEFPFVKISRTRTKSSVFVWKCLFLFHPQFLFFGNVACWFNHVFHLQKFELSCPNWIDFQRHTNSRWNAEFLFWSFFSSLFLYSKWSLSFPNPASLGRKPSFFLSSLPESTC